MVSALKFNKILLIGELVITLKFYHGCRKENNIIEGCKKWKGERGLQIID